MCHGRAWEGFVAVAEVSLFLMIYVGLKNLKKVAEKSFSSSLIIHGKKFKARWLASRPMWGLIFSCFRHYIHLSCWSYCFLKELSISGCWVSVFLYGRQNFRLRLPYLML